MPVLIRQHNSFAFLIYASNEVHRIKSQMHQIPYCTTSHILNFLYSAGSLIGTKLTQSKLELKCKWEEQISESHRHSALFQ